jgi:hypothetical protein
MITLKASIAAIVLLGAMGAAAGATYAVTRLSVAVSCPEPVPAAAPQGGLNWNPGHQIPQNQGKGF